jgi:class 3 adenylate cyclase/pimeloyl-ACP methyl ester carboxylesterase
MEPRIQYARTSDGANIAYAVFGEGTPLLYTPSAYGLGVHYYHMSYSRDGIDALTAAGFQLVRYDARGTGSSDRTVTEFSLEAAVLDLEAVAERVGWDRFELLGHFSGAQAAVAYAARRPERVAHLVLRDPWMSAADQHQMFPGQGVLAAMRPFAEQQWELVCVNIAAVGFGLADSDLSKEYAAVVRSGLTPATWVRKEEAQDSIDVTDLLSAVSVPTLVIMDTSLPGRAPAAAADWGGPAKKIAATIPNAHLVSTRDVSTAISEFVRGSQPKTIAAGPAHVAPGAFQTILFTDIAGSTALSQRLGDAAAQEIRRTHNKIVREALAGHSGSETKHTGDGIMAAFASASQAVACAVAIQQALRENASDAGSGQLRVRIGLNAGEPIAEERDLFGTSVDLAARLRDMAEPGEILISDVVRQLVAGKGFLFNDRGDHALKGLEDPVRVWEVRWRNE